MKNEPELLIAADKTTNFYKLENENPTRRHYLRRRKQSIKKTKTS